MDTPKKKIYMWYKVKELKQKGLNKSQISRELGLNRKTVRKYLLINEDTFHKQIEQGRNLPMKLGYYLSYVRKELQAQPYLSAAQVEDRLKEHYLDLPEVHSKTVYNFVQMIRHRYDIKKPKSEGSRQYEQLPPLPYGLQSQVDFGESYLHTKDGHRVKVYFFVMVLSRSRYKFVCFQQIPFTSETAVYAHGLAFEYFEGIPKEILYDQDSVFLREENLGDYVLTHNFQAFSQQQPFKVMFCRKADPESKGKVENVVGYVKKNFLRGRSFINIESLNISVLSWLERTGNGKRHSATQLIPAQEWEKEKPYLLPYRTKVSTPQQQFAIYNVRKDNTVNYKSNFYTLPLGTHTGRKTTVLLEEKQGSVRVYRMNKTILAIHDLCLGKGELIRNTGHVRDKTKSNQALLEVVISLLPKHPVSQLYLEKLKQDKTRYFNDNLRAIIKGLSGIDEESIGQSLDFCLENKLYNGYRLSEAANGFYQRKQRQSSLKTIALSAIEQPVGANLSMEVKTSDINTYGKIF
ncbi:MAG: IS21 family transposase [Bacteroidetes bacterium]|nr:IS21 family transposase [Bacteroidota bacterium]